VKIKRLQSKISSSILPAQHRQENQAKHNLKARTQKMNSKVMLPVELYDLQKPYYSVSKTYRSLTIQSL